MTTNDDIIFCWEWLGQAGFLMQYGNRRWMVDPYLSDALAIKYKNGLFPHRRMMPAPYRPEEKLNLDWVLCTHQHTDHMDAATLKPIHDSQPNCCFVVPRSWQQKAKEMGISASRLFTIDAGEKFHLSEDICIHALPSAHEAVRTDENGHHLFLGYVITLDKVAIYHSGDCIPYPGLIDLLREHAINVAFLPVNGRDKERLAQGIPGNFTIDEAAQLCMDAGIPELVCHHFGMFDFNTADTALLERKKEEVKDQLKMIVPHSGTVRQAINLYHYNTK